MSYFSGNVAVNSTVETFSNCNNSIDDGTTDSSCDHCKSSISHDEPEVEVYLNFDPSLNNASLQGMTLCMGCFEDLEHFIVEIRNTCS